MATSGWWLVAWPSGMKSDEPYCPCLLTVMSQLVDCCWLERIGVFHRSYITKHLIHSVTYSLHLCNYDAWLAETQDAMLPGMEKTSKPTSARAVFARNVRLARRLREVSQEALALQAGLSRTYVSEIERGERNVSIDNMGLLAEALGVPLRDLVDPEMFSDLPGVESS